MSAITPPPHFTPTKWMLIERLKGPEETGRAALNELCGIYWRPLYCFARQRGMSATDAEDATQGFFEYALERNLFGRADQERGRLRSLLLTAFTHYLLNEAERRRSKSRGGGVQIISMDATTLRASDLEQLTDGETPEKAFARAWAHTILDRVMTRLEEIWKTKGPPEWFETLKPFLSGGREGVETYEEAGRRLNVPSARVRLAAFRLRRSYREEFLKEIAETVASTDPKELEDELNFLLGAFA